MKKVKRISAIIIAVLFLSSFFAIPVHAVDPVSTGMALASAIDAYGMAYGIGSVYDVTDANGVVTSFDGLWDEFSLYQSNNGDSYNYQEYYANFDDSPSIQAFSHSSGKFAGFYIDAESAEVFDKFWNWLLSGPAEMIKVDNAYQWQPDPNTGTISPISVYSGNTINGIAVAKNSVFTVSRNDSTNPDFQFRAYPNNGQDFYAYYVMYNGDQRFVFFGIDNSVSSIQYRYGNQSINAWSSWSTPYGQASYIVGNNAYSYYSLNITSTNNHGIPIAALVNNSYSPKDVLGLTDSIPTPSENGVSVKPFDDSDSSISLPDVSSTDYQPTAKEIVTNIPWDENYDDTDEDENGQPVPYPPSSVTPIVDDMISSIIEDGFSIEDDPQNPDPDVPPPAPSEVFTPLLPVSPPSFEFNFAGIWHYVREWVSSLGTWFSLVFTVWGILPYAIVVPVYATAVIVIVLGVYKRFFM